jgi:Zn ribbon nucleic-acid-binding protein
MVRWRRTFMDEVSQGVQQLGVQACPVCGLSDSLAMGRMPVLLVEGEYPPRVGDRPMEEDRDRQLTFAIKVECTSCGYLMLFNSERYRHGDEQTIVLGLTEEQERQLEEE